MITKRQIVKDLLLDEALLPEQVSQLEHALSTLPKDPPVKVQKKAKSAKRS